VPAVLQALATRESMGAEATAARARERLHELGMSRARGSRAATRANPCQLTRRELEVAGLVCEGLTDGQVAERLRISRKTASHHVAAILAKLGAATRREVAGRLGLSGNEIEPEKAGGAGKAQRDSESGENRAGAGASHRLPQGQS
jgi:DNA-binding NarL/FixJ family response regulator